MHPSVFNWSTGKDSALALYHILNSKNYTVESLVTNVNQNFKRVSMHGLQEELLDVQAEAIGLPLKKIFFSGDVSMEAYSEQMKDLVTKLISSGITHSIYGDIFLEDLKDFRESIHEGYSMELVYPLWKKDTRELLEEFIDLGFKAIPVCINADKLDPSFLGRIIDNDFLKDLPEYVDPCGENGEFHTFVYDGPIFKRPVGFDEGEKVLRTYGTASNDDSKSWDTRFWYLDLIAK
ncbi:Dph6-related ATP pyrophosphatase [Winogradskyella aurantiaca]|uniref:Dph6-related ATP pyrophosphatase n=1 Tax=Winogradskyella aurantiaca TaxID=2219558 RepID=UPI000E1DD21E|nr:diphthine--ammonia ligase [Winogradskyella aurantiaca]